MSIAQPYSSKNWAYDASLAKSAVLPAGGGTLDIGKLGVVGLATAAHVAVSTDAQQVTTLHVVEGWNTLKTVHLENAAGGSYRFEGFVHADAILGGTGNSSVTLEGTKRGVATTGGGNDIVTVKSAVQSGTTADASNRFQINTGAGDDQVSVQAGAAGTNVAVTLGTGNDAASFTGVKTGSVDGGAGADRIDLGAGHTVFSLILRHDEADGDTYLNLKGMGARGGDVLDLYGYGVGAKLALIGSGVLRSTAENGDVETFVTPGVAKLAAGDYVFH